MLFALSLELRTRYSLMGYSEDTGSQKGQEDIQTCTAWLRESQLCSKLILPSSWQKITSEKWNIFPQIIPHLYQKPSWTCQASWSLQHGPKLKKIPYSLEAQEELDALISPKVDFTAKQVQVQTSWCVCFINSACANRVCGKSQT